MSKIKSLCQQLFLYLLLAVSGGCTALSLLLLNRTKGRINSREFIDLALVSTDEAYALFEQQAMYEKMLRVSLIAVGVSVLLLVLWYVLHSKLKQRARRATLTPEELAAEKARDEALFAKQQEKKAAKKARAAQKKAAQAQKKAESARAAQQQPPTVSTDYTGPRFCPNCGAPIEPGDAFCGNCAFDLR